MVFETGHALLIPDYRQWNQRAAVYEPAPFRSVVSVPLTYRQERIGVMGVTHDSETARFTPADQRLLELFANQAAVAIMNARLFRQTRDAARQVEEWYAKAMRLLGQLRFFNAVS